MRRILLPAFLMLASHAAHSQVLSIYGTFSPTHVGNVETGSVATNSGYQEQYTSFTSTGFGGGVTFGVIPAGPLRLGFDLRGSSKPGINGADTAMGGVKLGLHLPLLRLKPYIQGSVGYLATRTTNVSTSGNSSTQVGGTFGNQYLAYEVLGGVDVPIAPFIDVRLIEIGGGQGLAISLSSSSANASLFTVNTGDCGSLLGWAFGPRDGLQRQAVSATKTDTEILAWPEGWRWWGGPAGRVAAFPSVE